MFAMLRCAACCALLLACASTVEAGGGFHKNKSYPVYPWHGGYAHNSWGRPVAVVVPPTARFETTWGWGVGHSEMYPLQHQFGVSDPGAGGGQFRRTPQWPSHTQQFGAYPVRGPW